MADKRKELFSAARDESGDLEIYFEDSNIAISPSKKFWKGVVQELDNAIEQGFDEDNIGAEEGERDFKEVRDIIQECLENWE